MTNQFKTFMEMNLPSERAHQDKHKAKPMNQNTCQIGKFSIDIKKNPNQSNQKLITANIGPVEPETAVGASKTIKIKNGSFLLFKDPPVLFGYNIRMLKKADLFPTNPRWTVDHKQSGSTWKTVILTVGIIVASFFLSYSAFQHLWMPTYQLTIDQTYRASDGQVVSGFIIGARLDKTQFYENINFEYTSDKQKLPREPSCPPQLLTIDKSMICFKTRPMTFSPNDSLKIYLNTTFTTISSRPVLLLYPEIYALEKLLRREHVFTELKPFYGNSRTVVSKKKLLMQDSLVPGRDPENIVLLQFEAPKSTGIPPDPFTCFNFHFTFDKLALIPVNLVNRLSFPQILAYFISSIQMLTGIIGIFLIVVNSLYLKVELAKRLYDCQEIQAVQVSYLFTLKSIILDILTALKLHRKLIRKGYFRAEFLCSKAFEGMDVILSVENILTTIQTIKQNKLKETKKEYVDKEYVGELDYNLALDVETMASEAGKDEKENPNKFVVSRSQTQKSFFGNLIRSLDANPIQVEFKIKKQDGSSILGTILTYLGIGALIFVLIYLNSFSFDSTEENYTTYEPGASTFDTDMSYVMLDVGMTNATSLIYLPTSQIDVSVWQMGDTSKKIPFHTNCTHPDFGKKRFAFCLPNSMSLTPDQPIIIRIVPRIPVNITAYTRTFYLKDKGFGGIINPTKLYNFATQLLFTKVVQKKNDLSYEYMSWISEKQRIDYSLTGMYQVELAITQQVRYRSIQQVTIGDIFMRVWGLNLMFFMVMAVYISNYNRKIAKKETGRRYCTKEEDSSQKGEDILKLNTLVLYLRSKLETLPENSFYKENIVPPPALADSCLSSQPYSP